MDTKRTRRNIVKMGAILVSAAHIAAAKTALAHGNKGGNGNHWGWGEGDGDDHHGGSGDPQCLLRGTTIRTADGDRKIQDLKIGDLLPTVSGGTRPIQWIGRYPYRKSDPSKPWPRGVRPIRVARSALAPSVPHSDLFVSCWHALLLDGLLIPAGDLINGTTIERCEARECDELEYFHIKLDGHNVIYAEGAPVETMLNVEESASNFAEYLRLYGVANAAGNLCAPLATYGGLRGEFKSRIRSAVSPWLNWREPIDVIRDSLDDRAVVFLDLVG